MATTIPDTATGLLLTVSLLCPAGLGAAPPAPDPQGARVFAKHCVTCHGATGRGNGKASHLYKPRPRDFASVRFRILSTDNGVPTEDDLFETITRGMPGTAMRAWKQFPERERRALARHVRRLAYEGMVKDREADGVDRKEAEEIAEEHLEPGKPVELPPPIAADAQVLARGKAVYQKTCQHCHMADGSGRGGQDRFAEDGTQIVVSDLTKGKFKGGAKVEDILTRLLAGIPGTPMPSFEGAVPREDLWPLAHYVRSLVKPARR